MKNKSVRSIVKGNLGLQQMISLNFYSYSWEMTGAN